MLTVDNWGPDHDAITAVAITVLKAEQDLSVWIAQENELAAYASRAKAHLQSAKDMAQAFPQCIEPWERYLQGKMEPYEHQRSKLFQTLSIVNDLRRQLHQALALLPEDEANAIMYRAIASVHRMTDRVDPGREEGAEAKGPKN